MRRKVSILLFFIMTIFIALPVFKVYGVEIGNTIDNVPTEIEDNVISKYQIIIEDDANILTDSEETELKTIMADLVEFGNVVFKTTSTVNNSSSSLKYIQNYYYSRFNNESGVAFYIDMNQRQLCACATGGLDDIITNGKCDTIMDNVYTYASKGNYYMCASETFTEMNRLLNGQRIAESMKYICNAIVSVMLSLFASYTLFVMISGSKKASQKELIDECEVALKHGPIDVKKTGSHRVYSPQSSGSSSGGSSGGGRRRIFR